MSRLLNDLSNLAGKNNRAVPLYNLGLNSMNQKNYKSAINSFLQALKEDNSEQIQAMVRPSLGLAYMMENEFEKAIEELVKASNLKNTDNGNAFIHANLGYAYSQLKNYGLAIMEYKKSLSYRPDDAKVHYTLAMLYDSKFQADLAYREMQEALKYEPDNQTYIDAYNNLENTPLLNMTVGRLTRPLLTLGIIVIPSYLAKEETFYPMIVYIYPESPLKKIAREGDYIKEVDLPWAENIDREKGLIDLMNAEPGRKMILKINKSRTVLDTIPVITSKLSEEEKLKLYHNWFNTFDSKIVSLWQIESITDRQEIGAKWGYEFESLIRSWSAYRNDELFDAAFALMMEFFHAYVYSGNEDEVHYEINLSKLNFSSINISIIRFFKSIGFTETSKYLENKTAVAKINSLRSNKKKDK